MTRLDARLLERIKQMEHQGYDFEAAEGTFELLVREATEPEFPSVRRGELRSINQTRGATDETVTSAASRCAWARPCILRPPRAMVPCTRSMSACGNVWRRVYPAITNVRLTDYKVRVLGAKGGTESKVRVLVEWSDHQRSWATVGISDNVIDASWRALVDALRLELMRLLETRERRT